MVDLLGCDYDIIVRYQGGNNAGHTVINERGEFVLNLLPSGILRHNTVNVLGTGMIIDIAHLWGEIEKLSAAGIEITPKNLKISEKACICMPYHVALDGLEEDRLGKSAQGSTRRGIAPAYADKYLRKSVRIGDLLDFGTLPGKLEPIVSRVNVTMKGYGAAPVEIADTLAWLEDYGTKLAPFIANCEDYLNDAIKSGKNVMFEAQLGTLRDIDFGIYPYTTSSTALAAFAPIGAGVPGARLDNVIGIMKAYSSSVGGGPFTVEMSGTEAEELRAAGGEYGAATGRPRRVGAFDAVASRFGAKMQGADAIALTKLDVLYYLDKIPVCTAYDIGGERITDFPVGDKLEAATPVYEYLPGFGVSSIDELTSCRKFSELPENAQKYVLFIEKQVGVPIKYVSIGAEREQIIVR
jgi:adenylosuccinate synthase